MTTTPQAPTPPPAAPPPGSGRHLALALLVAALLLAPDGGVAAQPFSEPLPESVTLEMIEEGEALFTEGSCTRCHGEDARGSERAPDLTDGEWLHGDGSFDAVFHTIWWGVRPDEIVDPSRTLPMYPRGGMPIDWNQSRALAAYVWSLSRRDGGG